MAADFIFLAVFTQKNAMDVTKLLQAQYLQNIFLLSVFSNKALRNCMNLVSKLLLSVSNEAISGKVSSLCKDSWFKEAEK